MPSMYVKSGLTGISYASYIKCYDSDKLNKRV